ncbi:MAG: DUF1822 family protein [Elainellaceae cyanobacterium]
MLSYADSFDEFRLSNPECIFLESDDYERATQLSDAVIGENHQWKVYLHALALGGFIQWLRDHSLHDGSDTRSSLEINETSCSLLHPPIAQVIEAACNLDVAPFRLCLIAVENVMDEVVKLPQAVLELPEFVAHFYGVIEVLEEQAQVIIRGHASYSQLINYRQTYAPPALPDWTYAFPLSIFDAEPNHLLAHLRWLEPDAIPLPDAHAPHSTTSIALSPQDWENVRDHLQSPNARLWQSLSWEQGSTLLQHPELLELLYEWQQTPHPPTSSALSWADIYSLITQQTINTAHWLRGEVDELAAELGWFTPPMLAHPSYGFRSIDKFEAAIADLREQGLSIPLQSGQAYQDLDIGGMSLRLCAITWLLPDQARPRWALLLLLGTQTGTSLPNGLTLQVSRLSQALHHSISTTTELDDPFLYVQIEGRLDERFTVTIVPPDQPAQLLPPYAFDPEL